MGDLDRERFFARVCHDRRRRTLASRMADKRGRKRGRAYLPAGMLEEGLGTVPTEGTPHGGPVSPVLSKVGLEEWDKARERRGPRFGRYADERNLYGKSERAGRRVRASVSPFLSQRRKRRGKEAKRAVGTPQDRKVLGFPCTGGTSPHRRKIAPQSGARCKTKGRARTRRTGGISWEARRHRLARDLVGGREYCGSWETPSVLRELDRWMRRRLRCGQGQQGQGVQAPSSGPHPSRRY